MKFKPVNSSSYTKQNGMAIICVNADGKHGQLTKGKEYIYTGWYVHDDEYWYIHDDTGSQARYSKYRFRKATDLITDDNSTVSYEKEVELLKIAHEIEVETLKKEIVALKRENALLIRINDLETILGETK